MGIRFVLLVNKHGQTRLARYEDLNTSIEERRALEGEIVRKCLRRAGGDKQVSKQPNEIRFMLINEVVISC